MLVALNAAAAAAVAMVVVEWRLQRRCVTRIGCDSGGVIRGGVHAVVDVVVVVGNVDGRCRGGGRGGECRLVW